MGQPKFSRRKYDTPSHPWQGERIKAEDEVVTKYGLKNKRELWRAQSYLRNLRRQARSLLARRFTGDPQVELEENRLLARLERQGLVDAGASVDDVLATSMESVLSRRLQTQAFLKGLARTPSQARQLIVHGHVAIGGRRITIPGYLVRRDEAGLIGYAGASPFTNDAHPMRPRPESAERASSGPRAAPPAAPPAEQVSDAAEPEAVKGDGAPAPDEPEDEAKTTDAEASEAPAGTDDSGEGN